MITSNYKICTRCVMDTSDPDISFDEHGVCNHCRQYDEAVSKSILGGDEGKALEAIADKIKKAGKGKDYDSIMGLSGGVDSSYVAYLASQLGLRPLVVHFDNGWNSELAVSNIKNMVDKLGFDLMTYVIDWEEFRELQRAFIKASVVDIEMLTDHAHRATTYSLARQHNIKFSLVGNNFATEHGMPKSWNWRKSDIVNIRAIHKRFGAKTMRTYPTLGSVRLRMISRFGLGLKNIALLNYITYKKSNAKNLLMQEYAWRDYGGKHYESVFTKFYQAYILPNKFNIDKRKVHLSALIRNGEITKIEALNELKTPLYEPDELKYEEEFVLKKLGFTKNEFDNIMAQSVIPHDYYPTDDKWIKLLDFVFSVLRTIKNNVRVRSSK